MKPVRVYTTRICGYCVAAKRLLDRKGIAFEEIDVSEDPATRHWLVTTTGQRTVPQIFIGDEPIGGFTELRGLDMSGELDRRLAR
ncbi:MAG: glutaredoxin 3 [bacterium]|nr:glutaredoxin 3 [Myxococcales bacterium]MCB9542635.1 glutaredoxin 3 [Myxococcales bacterium]MCB9554271.1 glutaredoxin 3 [Myxococcales bacterium]